MHEPRYTTTTTVVETTEYIADDGPTVHIGLPKADCSYIRTLGGIMKLVCIILCFLCFMMILFARASFPGANWATFVTSIGLSITTTLLLLYIFRVVDSLPQIPWIVMEMCYCFAWTIFFFIAASVLAAVVTQQPATGTYAFASFFAFGAMCAYGFDCYLKFLSWKNNEIATGGGVDFLEQQRRRAQNV
ncbi:unnamed protein product [Auanema sp. JU1783]|nr:unnamed protein product [Auanema sp. JU1783]